MDDKGRFKKEIRELEERIDDLRKKMPAHSIPVSMMQDLEDLEDELDRKKKEPPA